VLPETGLYHTCFTVPDLEAAKEDLGRAFGLTWTDSLDANLEVKGADGHQEPVALRFCYSLQGAPYIELVQGPPGHPYFAAREGGHVHHVGLFVEDLEVAMGEYESQGMPMEFATLGPDGSIQGLSYHHNPYGASVELVSMETRAMVQAMIRGAGGDA